eukprot:ANDGO_08514.mRNA.1 hypothetical protein
MSSKSTPIKVRKMPFEPALRTLKWEGIDVYAQVEKQVAGMDQEEQVSKSSANGPAEALSAPANVLQNVSANVPDDVVGSPNKVLHARDLLLLKAKSQNSSLPSSSPSTLASPAVASSFPKSPCFQKETAAHAPSSVPPAKLQKKENDKTFHESLEKYEAGRKSHENEAEMFAVRQQFLKREREIVRAYEPLKQLCDLLSSMKDLPALLMKVGKEKELSGDLSGSAKYLKAAAALGNIEAKYEHGRNASDLVSLQSAAEHGHTAAMIDLARLLEQLNRFEEAVKWYKEAEVSGNALAQVSRIALEAKIIKKEERNRRRSHLMVVGTGEESESEDDTDMVDVHS